MEDRFGASKASSAKDCSFLLLIHHLTGDKILTIISLRMWHENEVEGNRAKADVSCGGLQ
ncbi:MAG: hypothetical protein HYV34_03520 [Candidatus Kerfeldbacteria bacterium]|nr:hypothetical protein [Candidatus Kerfeldbacteria bacterium]